MDIRQFMKRSTVQKHFR